MSFEPGMIVLALVVAAALVFGLLRRATDGTVHADQRRPGPPVHLGSIATFVQFSSAVCAPCATARRILEAVATAPGVEHVEIDVAQNLPFVEQYDVLRTPTVLILDSAGDVRKRIVGVPKATDLHAAIADLQQEFA